MDSTWYLDVNRFAMRTSWAHPFMKVTAVYGVAIFAVLVLAAWWYARYGRNATRAVAAVGWAAVGTVVAVGVNQFIVHAVQRPRPFVRFPHAEVLVAKAHDFSFPSDHSVAAGAATAGLWIAASYGVRALHRLAIASTMAAILVAFSRVYVGVHYPGDVVVGLLVGSAVVVVGWFLLQTVLTRLTGVIARAGVLRPMVIAHTRE